MSNLIKDAAAFLRDDRRRRNWAKVVQVMACVVVFVTTYALILPAITLETYTCGLAEHEHGLDCYQQITSVSEKQLSCSAEDIVDEETGEIIEVHTHSEECYTTIDVPVDVSVLTCGKADSAEHFHNDLCYGKWKLDCDKTVHIHDESCQPVSSANETEAAISTEAVTIPSEAETIATESTTAPTESTEEATVSTEAATESTEETTEATEETTEATEETTVPTEETVPEILEQVYSDDDVIVTVTYGPESGIPEGAQLVVETYSESYEEYYAQAQELLADEQTEDGENLEIAEFYLYDIHFLYEDQIIQPNEAVTVTIQFKSAVAGDPVSVIHFAEEPDVVAQTNLDENVSATFQTDSFSPYGFSVMAVEAEDEFQGVKPVPAISGNKTLDEHLIAYFSFDDAENGFHSVTTNAAGEAVMNGTGASENENFLEFILPNGDFQETDPTTNWMRNGYLGAYACDNNGNIALSLFISEFEPSSGAVSYIAKLDAGTYYFSFDLATEQETASTLQYTVTANDTVQISNFVTTSADYTWTNYQTPNFSLSETTDVTFTLSGTDQPANFKGWLDNLKLHSNVNYIDAKAVGMNNSAEKTATITENGYHGGALHLANNDYLKVTDYEGESLLSKLHNASTLDAITVSYWSKPSNSAGKNWSFFALPDDTIKDLWNTNQTDLSILEEGSYKLQQDHHIGNTRHEKRISGGTVDTGWHYITAVYSNSTTALYVNGVKIGETQITDVTSLQSILGDNSTIQIGKANYAANGEFYNGDIDEYRIYDIALTEEQIVALYESEAKSELHDYEQTRLAYFDFDNIENGFTDDKTGAKATISESFKNYYNTDAFYFTGSNFLTVTDNAGGSLLTDKNAITVSFWSKPENATRSNWAFYAAPDENMQDWNNGNGQETYLGLLVNGQYKMEQYNNGRGTPETNLSGGSVVANEWHYITAVYSGTALQLYIDGVPSGSYSAENFTDIATILGNESILQLGKANYLPAGEYYQGYMDEFRIYGSALSSADVAQLYRNEVKKENASYTTARTVPVDFDEMEPGKQYVIYTQDADGQYYALAAKPGDSTGYAVPIDFNEENGSFTWPADDTDNFFWTFASQGGTQYIVTSGSGMHLHAYNNNGPHGTLTGGEYPSTVAVQPDGSFTATGNGKFTGLVMNHQETNADNQITLNSVIFTDVDLENAANLRLAAVDYHYVWLDGRLDYTPGLMAYGDAEQRLVYCANKLKLPETWDAPTKYGYKLRGWYDIYSREYYPVDPDDGQDVLATITQNTVFYADWEPVTYNFGRPNTTGWNTPENPYDDVMAHTVDTSDFISIEMFDFNPLFNTQSLVLDKGSTISEAAHDETWNLVGLGGDVYGEKSLDFIFVDYDNTGGQKRISYPTGQNNRNTTRDVVTPGIVGQIGDKSPALLDILFDRNVAVMGKNFVGTSNHLFQYVDKTDPLYTSSTNPGYYYYDSKYNAASYSTDEGGRFYVYNYRERTTDSAKGDTSSAASSANSDFLPFNSPYVIPDGKTEQTYTIDSTQFHFTNYQYDAKYTGSGVDAANTSTHVMANYNFGMKVNISFFLPDDSGSENSNRSDYGLPMEFGFEGDDDLWVFLDDQLVLDVGGVHGVKSGSINFSTGEVKVDGSTTATLPFSSGDHNLTIYYLERGSSQSNCAIYFNLAPSRYGLELTKKDSDKTETLLPGAKFNIYLDPECTQPATLWKSETDKTPVTDGFTTNDSGELNAWGFVLGKTYYLKEIEPPEGYLVTDDIIAFTVHKQNGVVYRDITVLPGADGRDPGLEVIDNALVRAANTMDQEDLTLQLALTNRKNTTEVAVEKVWYPANQPHPDNVTVQLLANGSVRGNPVTLGKKEGSEDFDWDHTWKNLPITDANGNKINYTVQEVVLPGYTSQIEDITTSKETAGWCDVAVLEDGASYLLQNDNRALTVANGNLTWVTLDEAKENNALWTATAYADGYILTFGDYRLTLSSFTETTEDGSNQTNYKFIASTGDGNQTIYYNGTNLYAMIGHTEYNYDLPLDLMKSEMILKKRFRITNTAGYELPETGGSGTVPYTVSGLALMAAAAFLELNRRRRYV